MNSLHAIWQLVFIRDNFMFHVFEFYQKSAVKPIAKKEESDDDFDLFASSDEDKPPSKPSKKQKQVEIV